MLFASWKRSEAYLFNDAKGLKSTTVYYVCLFANVSFSFSNIMDSKFIPRPVYIWTRTKSKNWILCRDDWYHVVSNTCKLFDIKWYGFRTGLIPSTAQPFYECPLQCKYRIITWNASLNLLEPIEQTSFIEIHFQSVHREQFTFF